MISNKTAATLCLAISSMKLVVSTSPDDTQSPSASVESVLKTRKQRPAFGVRKIVPKLRDTTTEIMNVQPVRENVEEMDYVQEQLIPPVNAKLKELIDQGNYVEIAHLDKCTSDDVFMEQLCPVVTTLDHYENLVRHLGRQRMIIFYVRGNLDVVKEVITSNSHIYNRVHYARKGDLEAALLLAIKKDCHDRAIELFNIRKGITIKEDNRCKQKNGKKSFELFVSSFLVDLAPWKNNMALKRFLTLGGDKLRNKHPDILDTLCENLVNCIRRKFGDSGARGLLKDLIGQSSLLTPTAFARGFLCGADDLHRYSFVKYGWREAISEGLKKECAGGGEKLWRVMIDEYPGQFSGEYPKTKEAFTTVLEQLPTKQQKEDEWCIERVPGFKWKLENLGLHLFPNVLWTIIVGYVISSWLDVDQIAF